MRKTLLAAALIVIMGAVPFVVSAEVAVEPWTYFDDFEDRDLGAWASYPHWQDIAYDPNVRVNEVVPGDPNISFEQRVTPYTHVDNYAGAQKLLDMYLVPGATVSFRYYLKLHSPAEYLKVRWAAGEYGKLDVTIRNPVRNNWEWVTLSFTDFVRENPCIAGNDKVKIDALAFLAKVPDADPYMPFYFCFDDVTFKGARATAFQFAEPAVHKLPEFKPYIPKKHYYRNNTFSLSGRWPVDAEKVTLELTNYTDTGTIIHKAELRKDGEFWTLKPLKLSFPEGLYIGKLTAYCSKGNYLSDTEFTIHIAPKGIGGKHPRLLFDTDKKEWLIERLKDDRFSRFYGSLSENAEKQRERIPVESLIYDLDQFPEENWLPTWSAWGSHIYSTDSALRLNSLAYALRGDAEAGRYAKDVLVRLASWPDWTHPWQTKRGRFSEHRTGGWSHRVALAYDLTYDLMTEDERVKVRKAIMKNIVGGAHRTYVYNDNITGKTSNWLCMILGGTLMNQAAMFGDGPDVEYLEPYFTGAALKFYMFIQRTTDSEDGAWGEGLGYNNYSFTNLSYSHPSLMNVFNIDLTAPLEKTYKEYIWAGPIKNKMYFHHGDSGGNINASNWAFLLDRYKDPQLSWFYNYTTDSPDLWDALYELETIPQDDPFDLEPVKLFREVGTTVFKSGWDTDDFIFTMRTGAFYNHQHLDQGNIWLMDRGSLFFEERHGSTYYDDPLYQPWYTQPVAHSTILINGNHQSQRVGDHATFAEGFEDHAFVSHFLNGEDAAFSRGDIGRLYWGEVESLTRNAFYIKPRTVIMLDVAVPGKKDADVTALFQTLRLHDIAAGNKVSTVSKDGNVLHVMHLAPEHVVAEAVETPHYLYTLQRENPLVKEGMLTVTARTSGVPLVMANLMTTTTGAAPDVTTETGKGFVRGSASGTEFAFSTRPGYKYDAGNITTDALAMTMSDTRGFVAFATEVRRNGGLVMKSDIPFTAEVGETVKVYHCTESVVMIGAPGKPSTVTVNGKEVKDAKYCNENKAIVVTLPAGESTVSFK